MEFSLITIIAIVLAGIAGCVATAATANALADVPFKAVAGNVFKHIWSIIFVIPVPFLLALGGVALGYILSFLWLMMAPTVASKLYFGPKDVPWTKLMTFHAAFALVALIVFTVVIALA